MDEFPVTPIYVSVRFHGHGLALLTEGGVPYVALKGVVAALGLQWEVQYRRIQCDPTLGGEVCTLQCTTPAETLAMVALPLNLLDTWLDGIDTGQLRPKILEGIALFRRECFAVMMARWIGYDPEDNLLPPQSADKTGFTGLVAPVVILHDGKAVTTSQAVAEYFGKQHKNVLQSIENLLPQLPDEHKLNFQQASFEVAQPNGGTTTYPAYELTRDAFTLLAMGFTGKAALAFKLAYIEAFNKLEAKRAVQAWLSCRLAVLQACLFCCLGGSQARLSYCLANLPKPSNLPWLPNP